jgi:hypothetical protein
MVTQNETYKGGAVPYSPDILDDLPIDDQLAVEFFATARCASFKQAARGLNVPVVGLRNAWRNWKSTWVLPCLCTSTTSLP